MADIVHIYNRNVYQHNRKKKMRKSHIRNSQNLKITVIWRSHLLYQAAYGKLTCKNFGCN